MQKTLPFILNNLKRRKLRSWLTIIGIIVGVLAIVSLMSLSEGLKDSLDSEFDKLGSKKITVTSIYNQFGQETNKGLTTEDIKVIEGISYVDYSVGKMSGMLRAEYGKENRFVNITGYTFEYMEEMFLQNNITLLKGDFPSSDKSNEIIISYDYHKGDYEDIFDKRADLGSKIKISEQTYTVVGILEDAGSNQANRAMYTSINNIRELTSSKEDEVDTIFAIVRDTEDIELAGERIEEKLERKRGDNDFAVTTPVQAAEDREETLSTVSIVVIGIAAISLLVGGIGIMNSMYTSVLERKKEIGVMKAIGAKKADILKIFLLESGIIGIVGGIIGTIGGFLLAYIVNFIGSQLGVDLIISFNINIIIIALGFSFVIGLISGALPALQASNQEPIESLREE